MSVSIHLLTRFPPIGFGQMRAEAEAEACDQLERIAAEWEDRSVRYQLEGEALFVALLDDRLAGIAGLTLDAELPPEEAVRVHRIYVRPESRRHGVGRALIRRITEHALRHAPTLVVDAGPPPGPDFFEACGFAAVADAPGRTHQRSREDEGD